ncbi:MAG: hypothetical protein RL557_1017 [archaeon]|jgi:hypothetical protein
MDKKRIKRTLRFPEALEMKETENLLECLSELRLNSQQTTVNTDYKNHKSYQDGKNHSQGSLSITGKLFGRNYSATIDNSKVTGLEIKFSSAEEALHWSRPLERVTQEYFDKRLFYSQLHADPCCI